MNKACRGLKNLPNNAVISTLPSPVSELTLVCSNKGLHAILWQSDGTDATCQQIIKQIPIDHDHPLITLTKQQLSEYFAGTRTMFTIPLVLSGTAFQLQAWQQLQNIPYGETISYGEQARRLGDKNKARAVGMANGLNPIPIIVPCHRVIGSTGKLVGFGGGMDSKSLLLKLEQQHC